MLWVVGYVVIRWLVVVVFVVLVLAMQLPVWVFCVSLGGCLAGLIRM